MKEIDKLKYDEDYIITPSNKADELLPIKSDYILPTIVTPPNVEDLYFDILKYWRVVRRWALDDNKTLNGGELDMLLFLYREPPFDIITFKDASALMSWDRGRLKRLIETGWIEVYREYNSSKKNKKKLYSLTRKSKKLIDSIYNKLLQKEPMPEKSIYFSKDATFAEKMYREAIKRMNSKIGTALSDKS